MFELTSTHTSLFKSGQLPKSVFNSATKLLCVNKSFVYMFVSRCTQRRENPEAYRVLIKRHFWITFMGNRELHHTHTQNCVVCLAACLVVCVCVCWVWCVCNQANIKLCTRPPTAVGLLTFMLSNWFRVWFMSLSAPTCARLPSVVQHASRAHTPMCTRRHTNAASYSSLQHKALLYRAFSWSFLAT